MNEIIFGGTGLMNQLLQILYWGLIFLSVQYLYRLVRDKRNKK